MKKSGLWYAVMALALGAAALPALAQLDGRPRFAVPDNVEATSGTYDLHWEDFPPGAVNPRLVSFTWFYAKAPAGADRRRITTLQRDDFTNFRAKWQTPGPFGFEWGRKQNKARDFLQGPRRPHASPLVSNGQFPADSVVGLLVRPDNAGKNPWSIELRVQKPGVSLEFRQTGDKLTILEAGVVVADGIEISIPGANKWAWYEIGLQASARKDVELRLRVFSEDRSLMLAQFRHTWRLQTPDLRQDGGIALSGAADFAEIYVDPWSARWADDNVNTLRWITSDVPSGDYVLIAEVCDGAKVPRQIATDFRISVRNRTTDDAD